jgi:hypothetical protein
MTIETDLVIQMILRNHHLFQRMLLMSPHLRVLLTSVGQSLYVYDDNSVS